MPSLEDNKIKWGTTHAWTHHGDEWSEAWGGAAMQWHSMILPRIHRFLPTKRIIEIAPGHGRWTQFLCKYTD